MHLVKLFYKCYHRHSEIVSEYDQEIPQSQTADKPVIVKYNIGFKTLLPQGIWKLLFYGDLVYEFKSLFLVINLKKDN